MGKDVKTGSKVKNEEKKIVDAVKREERFVQKEIKKIPALATLLATFGLVSTLYGFEKVLDRTFLVEEPVLLLSVGLAVLLLTGAFYDRL